MPRGNGKHAIEAQYQGKLSAFIKPKKDAQAAEQLSQGVDWSGIDGGVVYGAVCSVVREGGALLLGASRDKSAYSVKVYVGGEGTAYYFAGTAEGARDLEAFLYSLATLNG